MELSPSLTGSFIQSSQRTGVMSSSLEMFRAVAFPVAIMLKASAGVLTAIACQFRFSTKTVDLFRTSLMVLPLRKG